MRPKKSLRKEITPAENGTEPPPIIGENNILSMFTIEEIKEFRYELTKRSGLAKRLKLCLTQNENAKMEQE